MTVNYVPPPAEFAALVVHRDARTLSTPQADHLMQSNSERRRYPANPRPPLQWAPASVHAFQAHLQRELCHVE